MPIRDYFCCLFLSNTEPQTPIKRCDAVLIAAREKLIASKQFINPAQLTDITPANSRDVTPRGSAYVLTLNNSDVEDQPTTSCRCC